MKLAWDSGFHLLAVGYHQSTIQIWNCDPDLENIHDVANIRGHRGYV